MDQRDLDTLSLANGCWLRAVTRLPARWAACPVQPTTPLGPDQVNVLLLLYSQTEALSTMDVSAFEPPVSAKASEKAVQVSEEAAISQLRPIQDCHNFWGVHGGAVTGSGAAAPGLAQTML
jgi:hypothetical protein